GAGDLEKSRGLLREGGRDPVSVFGFIAKRKAEHSVKTLCRVLGVSRSGFHAWERRAPSDRQLADAWLSERIREIHAESRQTYGARRVHAALRHRGVRVGRKRVERLMRRLGLSGLVPKRYRRTTIRVPGVRVADDLVERDFNPSGPNQLWVADIKYVRSWQGWLYLAAVVDCYSRRVVGWSMRADLEAELVVDALEMAVARRRPGTGLVHPSEPGAVHPVPARAPCVRRDHRSSACVDILQHGKIRRWLLHAPSVGVGFARNGSGSVPCAVAGTSLWPPT